MGEREIIQSWQSIHSDYLRFAVLSFRACKEGLLSSSFGVHLDRNVVDAIRYSYDCLESAIEFVFHMGLLKQLPIAIQESWLSRYIERNWGNLSLSDRIGILTYAWTGQQFWQTEEQFQLLEDLKRVRDGLTHPVPFGTEIEKEIITRRKFDDGSVMTQFKLTKEPKRRGSAKMSFRSRNSVVDFKQDPHTLGAQDAEQALEILLRHLARLEGIFFQHHTTWFGFYETAMNSISTTRDLLDMMNCRFEKIWELRAA